MSTVVAFIRQLLDAGLSLDDVLRAAEVHEASVAEIVRPVDETAERRRAKDRERKAALRGIPQTSADNADSADTPPSSPPPSPRPPTTPTPTPAIRATRAKAASKRCPEDWRPSVQDLAIAAGEGFSPGEIDRELAKLRDCTFGTARSDWSATFRNWIRRAAENRPRLKVHTNDRPSALDQRLATSHSAFERAAARRAVE